MATRGVCGDETWWMLDLSSMKRDEVSIRQATVEDGGAFAEFLAAAWREAGPDAPGFTGASEETIAEITAPEAFRVHISGPDRRMFLAWEEGRVVGFSATRGINENSVELSGIIVFRSRAGRGIGSALVESAMAAARGYGHQEMIVKTETTNHGARAFYENQGFRIVGVETEDIDDIHVEVSVLSRPL